LESAILSHPDVAEVAVIAIAHPDWDERPLALVIPKSGVELSGDELREFLLPKMAKWWVPNSFEFVDEIPKTTVGKLEKKILRERYADYYGGS
jgi:fatty-acyl-CoA synthase